MQKLKPLWPLLPVFSLVACTQALDPVGQNSRPTPVVAQEPVSAVIPGTLIVEFDDETVAALESGVPATKAGAAGAVLEGYGVQSVERLYPDAGEWEPRHRSAGLHRWYRIRYDVGTVPATKAAKDLASLPGIVSVSPERRIRKAAYFNDPSAPKQWALYNDGTLGNAYSTGCDINVIPVWENFTAGSNKVIVAVIDGGVQLNHPDLAAITIPGGANGSKSFINGHSGYNIPPDDHGTHVAGIIAAVNDNEIGISGIAGGYGGNGGVRILSCPFMMDDPSGEDKTIQGDSYGALVWAADHGAVIAQNSWGDVYDTEAEAMEGGVGAIKGAIDYFIQYAGCDKDGNQRADSPMKGGIVIFAAGNDARKIGWPAAYEPVVAVGALSSKFSRAYYSNYGSWVDICAPGGDYKIGPEILSTVANSDYGEMQGTSMACPHVSGVAALIVSYFGGPGFTNEMLKNRLLGGASTSKVAKNLLVGPMLDALGAFTYKGTTPPEPASEVKAEAASNSIVFSWKVTKDPDDLKAYGYLVLAAQDASVLQGINPRSIPASVRQTSVEVGKLSVGETISATLSELEFDTPYYTTVIAYDYAGNYAEGSAIRTVRTGKNNPPVITTDYTGDYRVKPFETLSVQYSVSDPDGHSFEVAVTPGSDAFTYTFDSSKGQLLCRIIGNAAPHGKYRAHIVATDHYGVGTDYSVDYEILENHAPKVVSTPDDLMFGSVGASRSLNITEYIQDEDGEPLTYTITTSDQNVAHLNPNGDSIQLTTLGYGLVTATVTATDACKASASVTFRILVRDETRPVDLYPIPVVSALNIRPGTSGQITVSISNKAGAVVWSGESAVTPFDPLSVDLSGVAGGSYYVTLQGAGTDGTYPIVKR